MNEWISRSMNVWVTQLMWRVTECVWNCGESRRLANTVTSSQRRKRKSESDWRRRRNGERGALRWRNDHTGELEGRAREWNTGRRTERERERARCKHIHHMLQIISLCFCHNWLTDWPTGWLTGWLAAILAHWLHWLPYRLGDGMADWLTDCLDGLLTNCCLTCCFTDWNFERLTGRLITESVRPRSALCEITHLLHSFEWKHLFALQGNTSPPSKKGWTFGTKQYNTIIQGATILNMLSCTPGDVNSVF